MVIAQEGKELEVCAIFFFQKMKDKKTALKK